MVFFLSPPAGKRPPPVNFFLALFLTVKNYYDTCNESAHPTKAFYERTKMSLCTIAEKSNIIDFRNWVSDGNRNIF